MSDWLPKTILIAIATFMVGYVLYVATCIIATVLNPQLPPAPAFLWGIPAGAVAAVIAVIVRVVLKSDR